MKYGLFTDSITDASAKLVLASLPFMTMGMIGHPALLIASGSVGCLCLFIFLIRIFLVQKNGVKVHPLLDAIMEQMWFPYICGVSFAIGTAYGEVSGWWGIGFGGVLAICIIIANCVSFKQNSDAD